MAASLANNPTRQQLDELDDLLQKMLALPINQLDEALAKPPAAPAARSAAPKAPPAPPAPPKAPPQFPASSVAYGVPPAPAFAADSPAVAPAATTPSAEAARGWSIDLNPKEGSSVLGDRSPLASDRPVPAAPVIDPKPMISVPLRVNTVADVRSPAHREPEVPFLLMPCAAVTHAFDGVMSMFGPLGRLTASTPIRQLMGLAGLSMLGGGLTWGYLIWAGWTW